MGEMVRRGQPRRVEGRGARETGTWSADFLVGQLLFDAGIKRHPIVLRRESDFEHHLNEFRLQVAHNRGVAWPVDQVVPLLGIEFDVVELGPVAVGAAVAVR